MNQTRQYVEGIAQDGSREFLTTHLDKRGCVEYIQGHRKTFPNRYVEYSYGSMSQDKSLWSSVK